MESIEQGKLELLMDKLYVHFMLQVSDEQSKERSDEDFWKRGGKLRGILPRRSSFVAPLLFRRFLTQFNLQRALRAYHALIESTGLRLTQEGAGKGIIVVGNEYRIHQIVLNFVSNAIKFTVQARGEGQGGFMSRGALITVCSRSE